MKAGIIFLLPILLFLNSCTNDNSVSPVNEVDPELIGAWYYIDTVDVNIPSPHLKFFGFLITDNKEIRNLGIETETGKVKVIDGFYKTLVRADNNILITKSFSERGGMITDSFSYKIENGKLLLSGAHFKQVFYMTQIDTNLFKPISSSLSLKLNNHIYENIKISGFPAAYATINLGTLSITSELYFGYKLKIVVNSFNSEIKHDILPGTNVLDHISGDVIETFYTDSLYNNTISIEKFSEEENICSGKFSVSVKSYYSSPPIIIDGIFSLAIYRYGSR